MQKLFGKIFRRSKIPAPRAAPRHMRRGVRRLQIGVLIGALVGVALAALVWSGVARPFESRAADLFYRPRAASGDVVLIVVDTKSVEEYGWPIDRVTHSAFLFAVMRAQPQVIALDFILSEPNMPEEDEFFGMVLRRGGKMAQPVLGVEATRYPFIYGFPAYDSVLLPAAALRPANVTLGHTMIYPDADGVTRRVPLAIDAPGIRYPALAFTAFALFRGIEPTLDIQGQQILLTNAQIPLDQNGQMLLSYTKRETIRRISYSDVTQGKIDYSILRNKIVLVGPSTVAVREAYNVPLTVSGTPAANVEIQADVLEALLAGSFLREQERGWLMLEVALIAVLASATLIYGRWLYAGALALLYLAAYLVYAFQRFDSGVIITPLYVMLALGATYGLTQLYRYFSEERGKVFVARAFVGMVSPETVNKVVALHERGMLSLSGGRRMASVLCIGLRELAGLAEVMAPETVLELLNRYTARILQVVFESAGSINKVGNNIVVVWNLPLDQPDHAHRAVNTAFGILRGIEELHPVTLEERHIGVSLGIATGMAIAGQINVATRADYTVVGEVVTLAERISALASDNQVLVDPETYEQIRAAFNAYQVHTLRVRGRKDPVIVRQVEEKIELKEDWH